MSIRLSSERGLTILEIVLIITITVVIMGGLAPVLGSTIGAARIARANTDMTAIATQLQTALTEMGFVEYTITGAGPGAKVQLMVSDGDIAACTAAPTGCGAVATGWDRPTDMTGGLVDFIENHLVHNAPRASVANDYPVPAWKGPYLHGPVDPDPWGNRYMVNASQFNTVTNTNILSAGPNETIETVWSGTPLAAGGDDLVALVQP